MGLSTGGHRPKQTTRVGAGRATDTTTIGAAQRTGVAYLRALSVPEPERSVELLLAHCLGVAPGELAVRFAEPMEPAIRRELARLLRGRARRLPVQHLVGTWEFYGLELEVSPAALIPRPETEELVELALASWPDSVRRVADVGTGTGCIALALAHERPQLEVYATDISAVALELASRNADALGLRSRVHLHRGDLLQPLGDVLAPPALDAVIANPPYVADGDIAGLEPEVREHEPRLALAGGVDGLAVFERLLVQAATWLRPGGWLLCELGDGHRTGALSRTAACGMFEQTRMVADLRQVERFLVARRRNRLAPGSEPMED